MVFRDYVVNEYLWFCFTISISSRGARFYQVSVRVQDFQQFAVIGKVWQTISYTLQLADDLRIPHGEWGQADWLEPVTKDFPEYGEGGATQAVTNQRIVLDSLEDLLE